MEFTQEMHHLSIISVSSPMTRVLQGSQVDRAIQLSLEHLQVLCYGMPQLQLLMLVESLVEFDRAANSAKEDRKCKYLLQTQIVCSIWKVIRITHVYAPVQICFVYWCTGQCWCCWDMFGPLIIWELFIFWLFLIIDYLIIKWHHVEKTINWCYPDFICKVSRPCKQSHAWSACAHSIAHILPIWSPTWFVSCSLSW